MNSIRLSPLALTRALATALVVLAAGCTPPKPPPQLPAPSTVVSFTASSTSVAKGESIVLSWEVKDAESVTLTTDDGTSLPGFESKLKGSLEVTMQQTELFLLNAQGPGGADSATLRVEVAGSADELMVAAVPAEISAGESSTLIWSAPRGLAVTIRDQSGQVLVDNATESNGSRLVQPRFTTTYELETSVGKAQTTLQVAPAIFTFQADKPAAEPGEAVALSWTAGGGDRLVVRRGSVTLVDTREVDTITSGRVEDPAPPAIVEDGVLSYTLELYRGDEATTRRLEDLRGSAPRFGPIEVPSVIAFERPYTISWQAFKTDRVEISIGEDVYYVSPTAEAAAQGSLTLNPPTAKVTLTLRALNDRGGEDVESRDVEPVRAPGPLEFSAGPQAIVNGGEPVVLTWSVPHSKRTVIRDDRNRIVASYEDANATGGTLTHFPNRETTYTITADNKLILDGELQQVSKTLAPVTVQTPAALVFDKPAVGIGGSVTVVGATAPGTSAVRVSTGDFVDITDTGSTHNMEGNYNTGKENIILGQTFSMPLFGETVTGDHLCISPNGWMYLNTSTSDTCAGPSSDTNPLDPKTLQPFTFAPYFTDLDFVSSNLNYYFQFDNTPMGKRLIVQWNDSLHGDQADSDLRFQVQLYENGGVIFAYKTFDVRPENRDGWIGIRDGTSSGLGFAHAGSEIIAPMVIAHGIVLATEDIPFPLSTQINGSPLTYQVVFAGGVMEISGSPEVIPANSLVISEVLFYSSVAGGEYVEVVNRSAAPSIWAGSSSQARRGQVVRGRQARRWPAVGPGRLRTDRRWRGSGRPGGRGLRHRARARALGCPGIVEVRLDRA